MRKSRRRPSFYNNLTLKRALVAAAPFWVAAAAQGANAATFNASDVPSLRTAINSANSSGTSDEIVLAAGTYSLTGATLENANASGDLDITKAAGNLLIRPATGANVILDGSLNDRVFHVNAGGALTVTIRDLTIQNGRTADNGTATGEARGGGILLEQGGLVLENVSLLTN
jgi:hypothetical protein